MRTFGDNTQSEIEPPLMMQPSETREFVAVPILLSSFQMNFAGGSL